jgi:hypothetical protein
VCMHGGARQQIRSIVGGRVQGPWLVVPTLGQHGAQWNPCCSLDC